MQLTGLYHDLYGVLALFSFTVSNTDHTAPIKIRNRLRAVFLLEYLKNRRGDSDKIGGVSYWKPEHG